jgi:DNA-binding CsgD family transcriptional regulator
VGCGERKRAGSGWAALTRAELDVVRLVGERLGNKEIAARLFVSHRTVHAHLTHVYTKLGLGSRVQLAQDGGASWLSRFDEIAELRVQLADERPDRASLIRRIPPRHVRGGGLFAQRNARPDEVTARARAVFRDERTSQCGCAELMSQVGKQPAQ